MTVTDVKGQVWKLGDSYKCVRTSLEGRGQLQMCRDKCGVRGQIQMCRDKCGS